MTEAIGSRVRSIRKEQTSLSQEGLARKADTSLNVINRLERGAITDPHISTLIRISKALEVPLEGLLFGEDVPKAVAPNSSTSSGGERRIAELSPWIEYIERRATDWERLTELEQNPFLQTAGVATQWEFEVSRESLEIIETVEQVARGLMQESSSNAAVGRELHKLEDAYRRLEEATRKVTAQATSAVTGAGRAAIQERQRKFELFLTSLLEERGAQEEQEPSEASTPIR